MKKEDTILNCPFCGGNPFIKMKAEINFKYSYFVLCKSYRCGGMLRADTRYEAIQRWNKRIDGLTKDLIK
jgi:Lar family restriction alleviation protein